VSSENLMRGDAIQGAKCERGEHPRGDAPVTKIGCSANEPQAARCQSITLATQAFRSGSRRRRYGVQPRWRNSIDTSAASAVSGTLKPALMRPFGVSTNTRHRRR
jgi:hypothetical protein